MSVTTRGASSEVREYVRDAADEQQGIENSNFPAPAPGRTRKARSKTSSTVQRWLSVLPPILLALVVLMGWYASTTAGHISILFLPKISDVLASLADGLGAGAYLSSALLVTVQESIFGFLLALAIALPLGFAIAKSRLLAWTFQPYLAAAQAIPALVLAPFFVLWLGYSLFSNIVICTLVIVFPMVVNTVLGIQTIDPAYIDAARVEGAAGWSLLAHIEFPLALPAILAAIRTGFTLSITGAIVGEFVNNNVSGLGALVLQAKEQYNTPLMFATLVVLAALAALYYGATWLLVKLAARIY
jgi:NitT/TauT family transport system permease protein